MTATRWVLVALIALVTMTLEVRGAEEEKVDLGMLPDAVAKAVKDRFPAATLVAGSKEFDEGKLLYEVSIVDTVQPKKEGKKPHKQRVELAVTPEGDIVEIEKQISPKHLPKPVQAVLDEKYPGANVRKAEQIFKVKDGKERLAYIETLVDTKDQGRMELAITKAGEVAKVEKKGANEDDEDISNPATKDGN